MINILPKNFLDYMWDHLRHMKYKERTKDFTHGFDKVEIEKFKRVVDYMAENPVSPSILRQGRRDFYTFFTEHDKRRGTNFISYLPRIHRIF